MSRGGSQRLSEAEGLLKRAIDIDENCDSRGPTDIDTAKHLGTYSDCLRDQGRYEEALELQRRAFSIDRDNFMATDVDFGLAARTSHILAGRRGIDEALNLLQPVTSWKRVMDRP